MLVYVVVLFRLLEKRGENCHLGALSYQVFLATLKKEEKTNKLVLNVSKTEKIGNELNRNSSFKYL